MTPPTPVVVAGIDVGKSGLDAYILPGSLQYHFKDDKPGRRALRKWLRKQGVTHAIFAPQGATTGASSKALSRRPGNRARQPPAFATDASPGSRTSS